MGRRGPVSGASFGMKSGPKSDPQRPSRRQVAAATAKSAPAPAKKVTKRTKKPATPSAVVPIGSSVPAPPSHLGVDGLAVWLDVWSGLPRAAAHPKLDRLSVTRLAEAVDDRKRARAALIEHGTLLEEPIVSPKGDVVGTRLVPNPAEAMLRRADKAIDELSDRLGLSPAARARLGLAISRAALAGGDVAELLARARRPAKGAS